MPSRNPEVQRLMKEHPWAVLPGVLAAFAALLERRFAGDSPSRAEIESAIGRRAASEAAAPASIAVLPIHGLIWNRASAFDDFFGLTSTESIGRALATALADPAVGAIVLDVNSPGGSVYGVEELGGAIAAARGAKPIVAVVNALAASAAYWLASQADELVVTPSGDVGSIGVYSMHVDYSEALAKEGISVSFISAGKYKVEGNPYEPLGEEARAYEQSRVDEYYASFVKAVATGRGTSQANVRENFGQGRVVGAAAAVATGMADREGTLQDVIGRLAAKLSRSKRSAAADVDVARARLGLAAAERRS